MKKIISIIFAIVIIASSFGLVAFASPSNSFTHYNLPGDKNIVNLSREMYTAVKTITASSLGISETLEGITDICIDSNDYIYVLCGASSRIVVINQDYTFNREIAITDKDGNKVSYEDANGIYIDNNGLIYISDTQNERVLVAEQGGKIKDTWTKPTSSIIPADFKFNPTAVTRDEKGYYYVLSQGSYYGALSYTPQGEFLGFYGANTVEATALDTLGFLWDKLTSNDTKKANSAKKLPYSFVDFSLDDEGYMLVCTGKVGDKVTSTGQIRKISPNGADILYKRNSLGETITSSSVNFLEDTIVKNRVQDIVSIDVDNDGFIYALDRTYGLIYVYDSECNLLNAFGGGVGQGVQEGVFYTPIRLALHKNSLIVADKKNCSITVFDISSYGTLIKEASTLYNKGDYIEAKALWSEVLSMDRGNQMAYRGLAMACYSEGDYNTALDYAKKGMDYTVYDLAYQELLSDFFMDNFVWVFFGVAIILGGLITLLVVVKKKNLILIKNQKVKVMLSVPFHPFRSFEEIKYKKMGSVKLAVIMIFVVYFTFLLKSTASGFCFTTTSIENYNMLYTILQSAGLIMLWVVANWLVSSLLSGKGTFKEVLIATTYSLIPIIVYTLFYVGISHVISISGMEFLSGLQTVAWVFTFFNFAIGMMIIHEYDFFKFLWTTVITVMFMLLIVFLLFIILIFSQQLLEFFMSIYKELVYR